MQSEKRKPEEWRVYPSNPRYEVSSHGRIKAVGRWIDGAWGPRYFKERIRAAHPAAGGHLIVQMYWPGDVAKSVYVHRAVLETFVGAAPADKPFGLHANRNPADNYVGNLRWGSQAENMADKVAHGMQHRGESTPTSKLTAKQVRAIRADVRGSSSIALEYGISKQHAWRIRTGKVWRHIDV